MENKIKHLEMIEAVIERIAKNSFQLKSWTMTLVTAICALASQGSDKRFIVLAFVPIIGFWILDSFYLQQERKYKLLYKDVATKNNEEIDFNMDTAEAIVKEGETGRLCILKCIFSVSELCFYLVIGVAIVILLTLLRVF